MTDGKDPNTDKQNNSDSTMQILWAGISIALPILLIFLYSYSGFNFSVAGISLKKFPVEEENVDDLLAEMNADKKEKSIKNGKMAATKNAAKADSIAKSNKKPTSASGLSGENHLVDSTKHRVMILGDSECGGLCYPLNDYCITNGHELAVSLVWNSATIYTFAYADTLEAIINKYKPTFIFFVVGLNELTTKELKRRKVAADLFMERISGIPYAWIGPANYCEDHGLNKIFQSAADSNAFFMTKNLDLPRGGDGRHPNAKGYRIWMDSIASWISTKARYKLAMKKPDHFKHHFKSKVITFNAAKFRGYK